MYIHSYRPQKIDEIVEQEHIKKEMKNWFTVKENGGASFEFNIPKLLLIHGPTGTGKNTISYIISKLLLCEDPFLNNEGYYEPCDKCHSCSNFGKNNFGKNNGFIYRDGSKMSIDNIKNIQNKVMQRNIFTDYNIVLIDEAHLLAQKRTRSSLLTLTDAPPEFGYLILSTSEIDRFDKALVSRFNSLPLYNISAEGITEFLLDTAKKEELTPSDGVPAEFFEKTIPIIARRSEGSMRLALQLLEKCKNTEAWSYQDLKKVSGL